MPAKRTASGLIIPASAVARHAAFQCRICEAQFGEHQLEEYTRHCVVCAKRNEGELENQSVDKRVSMFSDVDHEYEEYVRRTGRDRITEALRRRR